MEGNSNIEADLLIGKYLTGNSTPSEMDELMHWLNSSEENRMYFAQYKMMWLQSGISHQQPESDKWEQLQNRIESRENTTLEFNNILEENKERSFRILKIAATIIILVGLATAFFNVYKFKSSKDLITENVIDVPYGSKLSLILPDRSRLWINSGSKVVYNNKFGIDNRDIKIIGEVYFDVEKNPKLPFIVHAGDVKIKAIGTAFNVKAYPEEKRIETTLIHGSVQIEKAGNSDAIILKPSEKIVINEDDVPLEKNQETKPVKKSETKTIDTLTQEITIDKRIDTEKETAWKEGKLIFDREPLETLTVELMRKYDVTFSFADERLKSFRFSGTFFDLSLEQIMDAMKFSAPIDYEIDEKKVIIKQKSN